MWKGCKKSLRRCEQVHISRGNFLPASLGRNGCAGVFLLPPFTGEGWGGGGGASKSACCAFSSAACPHLAHVKPRDAASLRAVQRCAGTFGAAALSPRFAEGARMDSALRGNDENDSYLPKPHLCLLHFSIANTDHAWALCYEFCGFRLRWRGRGASWRGRGWRG